MKKWIAFILSLYLLFSAIVPCSIFDNCEQNENTQQTSDTDHKKDCGGCPPFSICSATHGFTINSRTPLMEPIQFYPTSSYSQFYSSFKSEYYSSYFQPPRFV